MLGFSNVARFLIGLGFLWAACCLTASLAPLTIKDVSLMLRSGYSSDAVLAELSKRRLVDMLDSSSEKQLLQSGGTQSLIDALRSGVYQLSAAEIAAWEKQKQIAHAQSATNSDLQTSDRAPAVRSSPPTEVQMGGSMYDHFKDDLVYWHEGNLIPVDDEALQKKKFYLLFFSAIWSKEGRQLTTRLVDYYNRVTPQHPEFEVIFFSVDRSQFAMENYINQTSMPWPVVAYDKRNGKAGAIQRNLVQQIPHLILVDGSGKILSDSGDNQPNFDKVLADLDNVLAVK